MGEVVNLRRARKTKLRTTDAAAAATHRARHGRTKAQRAADEIVERRRDRLLDGARREDS